MAYEKNTWQTGDVITKEKLNHMEDGIANSELFFVVPVLMDMQSDPTIYTPQVTFGEASSMAKNGKIVVIKFISEEDNSTYNSYFILEFSSDNENESASFYTRDMYIGLGPNPYLNYIEYTWTEEDGITTARGAYVLTSV